MAFAFSKLRPIFRRRSEITAEVTGRLAQTLGGARIVKAYTAEKREEVVFTRGVNRLFRNIASTITGVSAISAVEHRDRGRDGRADDGGRRTIDPRGDHDDR